MDKVKLCGAILLLLALLSLLLGARTLPGIVLVGPLSATDSEADEGYFGVGTEGMLRVPPGSEGYARLKALVGKEVIVKVEE